MTHERILRHIHRLQEGGAIQNQMLRLLEICDPRHDPNHQVGDQEFLSERGGLGSAKTCEGKVVEVDGIKYKLKAL